MWYELWLYAYNHGGECYWAIIIEGTHTGFLQNRDDSVILEAWGDYRHQQGEVKDVCEDICHYVSGVGSTYVSVKLKTLQSLTGHSSFSLALARRILGSGEWCCLFLSLTRTRGLFNPFLRRFFHTHVQSIGVVPDCEYLRTSKRVSVIGDQCIAC